MPRMMLVEGGVLLSPKLLESRRRAEVENGEPHVGLSEHNSVFPGTSMSHFKLPLGSRTQVALAELYPVPTGSEPSLAQCQGSYHCQIGFSFTAEGLFQGVDPTVSGLVQGL